MLILFRPYKLGQFVDIGGTAGTVKDVNLFVTELATADNVQIIVPNGQAWGSIITNFSAHDTRRVDLVFGIDYGDDIEKAKAIILKLANADARVKQDPEPWVRVTNLGDSSVDLTTRLWCDAGDYWELKFAMTQGVKKPSMQKASRSPIRIRWKSRKQANRLPLVRQKTPRFAINRGVFLVISIVPLTGQLPFQDIAQDLDHLLWGVGHSQRGGVYLFQGMLMFGGAQHDHRLAQCCSVARIKRSIPLLVLLAKTDNHNISAFNPTSGANGVQLCAFVVMPEFAVLGPHNRNTAVIRGIVICDWAVKSHIKASRAFDNLFAPIGVDFTRKIDLQCHCGLLRSSNSTPDLARIPA